MNNKLPPSRLRVRLVCLPAGEHDHDPHDVQIIQEWDINDISMPIYGVTRKLDRETTFLVGQHAEWDKRLGWVPKP